MNFQNDIPLSAAISAHRGTSMVPEKRGEQMVSEYVTTLTGYYQQLKAGITSEKYDLLDEEFAKFRERYKARYLSWLSARSRCMSTMIAGPSNFPVRRAEKANSAERARLDDLVEFKTRAMNAIWKKLHPELAPIAKGDDDAVSRLQEKLEKLEKEQAQMKAVNAMLRVKKTKEERIAGLLGMGFSQAGAEKCIEPDCFGYIGFAPFELKNNNANIRRIKQRIIEVGAAKSRETQETEFEGAKVEVNHQENRVRLYFSGKPSVEVRNDLKRNGFRWSPTIGAWQAYVKQYTVDAAKRIAATVLPTGKLGGEKDEVGTSNLPGQNQAVGAHSSHPSLGCSTLGAE